MKKWLPTVAAACAVCATLATTSANAQFAAPVEVEDGVNLIGLGAGVAPDFMGSKDNDGAVGPLARYQFSGTDRYILVLGPQITYNMLNNPNWRFGPMANFRSGRGGDVDNPVVKQMVGINNTWEGGVFVSYKMPLSSQKMHQITFTADIAGSGNGIVSTPRMTYWKPLGPQTLLTVGFGVTLANDKWMDTYFGLTNAHDISLFPTQGGRAYHADGGVKGVNIPIGISQFLTRNWLLSGGVRYEKLTNDAKDSPIVEKHGDDNQLIGGIALSYVF